MRTPKVVTEFENSTRVHEMKGSYRPEDWELIELQFKTDKEKLINYIEKLKNGIKVTHKWKD